MSIGYCLDKQLEGRLGEIICCVKFIEEKMVTHAQTFLKYTGLSNSRLINLIVFLLDKLQLKAP